MLYLKQEFPEEDELVLCTVTNVQYHSVFVKLDEYDKQGMIHISEVSPGRIRNIRDFVVEGKKVVCKVLRINTERGHIDLSLRRVTESQRRQKTASIKQEIKAEKILQSYVEQHKVKLEDIYKAVSEPLFEHYEYLFQAFEDVVENNVDLGKLGVDKAVAKQLMDLIREKIKPRQVLVKGNLHLQSYEGDGVDTIKAALLAGLKVSPSVSIKYLGAAVFYVEVTAKEYKEAEQVLKDVVDAVKGGLDQHGGVCTFERLEK
ncbi:MAG: S1 RNA-binding domain-containing protein [Nanoarchaeota archaeon]